jgi:hypothetical protein
MMSEQQYYDVIGDIHGHADALRRLLAELGYAESQGVFRHDTRKVIFVGDFVDRGPEQREVLRIARNMCEAKTANAVLGNHELNAIAWATPNDEGGFLRERSQKNLTQHENFLGQLGEGSSEHHDAILWFRQLPLWLEFPGLRVVHACWYEPSRAALRPYLDATNCFTDYGFREAHRPGSEAFKAAEILLKGPEQTLPAGIKGFTDKHGHRRQEVRLRWWDPLATTFRQAAIGMDERRGELPDDELPIDYRYKDRTPVLFGHYSIKAEPTFTYPTVACLDFGVDSKGYLTAYRWSGENKLLLENLVHVSAEM